MKTFNTFHNLREDLERNLRPDFVVVPVFFFPSQPYPAMTDMNELLSLFFNTGYTPSSGEPSHIPRCSHWVLIRDIVSMSHFTTVEPAQCDPG